MSPIDDLSGAPNENIQANINWAVSPISGVTFNSKKNVFVLMESLKQWLSFVNNNRTSALAS